MRHGNRSEGAAEMMVKIREGMKLAFGDACGYANSDVFQCNKAQWRKAAKGAYLRRYRPKIEARREVYSARCQ
jgi:hypothetical protein